MFKSLTSFIFVLSLTLSAFAGEIGNLTFPDGPHAEMTPGVLCTHADSYRYEEHIPYCSRAVSSSEKQRIIAAYDNQFGYSIQKLPRGDFKIDHFIPLSIGGANDVGNLWPQHKSIYKFSDPIEEILSELMIKGRIKQADAILAIKNCKYHLETCAQIQADLEKLLH